MRERFPPDIILTLLGSAIGRVIQRSRQAQSLFDLSLWLPSPGLAIRKGKYMRFCAVGQTPHLTGKVKISIYVLLSIFLQICLFAH